MAPTPSKSLIPTPKANQTHHPKTPQSKHSKTLNFNTPKPSPAVKEPPPPAEHPVEVIGRIRDYPDRKEKPISALHINLDRQSIRVRTDIGSRDFILDGVSLSEEDGLEEFYQKFVGSRINGVKLGDKCTIMMYGPTGSGKSHTMFGCGKEQGIVYKSLRDILGNNEDEEIGGMFVRVSVLEIYNEEIYDLLSTNSGGGFSLGWSNKGNASKNLHVGFSIIDFGNEYVSTQLGSLVCTHCSPSKLMVLGASNPKPIGLNKSPHICFDFPIVLELKAMLLLLHSTQFRPKHSFLGRPKVRLEVMGKKAKNATFISGNEAGKISKEVQKVEKRRIVKSTLCNERSSRSHCMIILDVPTVGGRLMLVDMAGSENIEQAGQNGLEAKMQTGKINQGNIALKRVVESIANGDSHVPFRDSKLTMLLQDSFEDDKSKILMILCASPDPKEMHKTISTLEYGAKAKCIVRGPHTPIKENGAEDSSSAVILGSRIAAMDQFIYKLQMENKVREKERNEAHKQLMKKEEEVSALRAKLALVEKKGGPTSEEEIKIKVNERTQLLKIELEKKIEECQKMADEYVEMERRKMEEKIFQQQQELEMLRRRLEEIESELCQSRDGNVSTEIDGNGFAKRLCQAYGDEDPGMEKSMDLDKSFDLDVGKRESSQRTSNTCIKAILGYPQLTNSKEEEENDMFVPNFSSKQCLSTVFEEEEEGDDDKGKHVDEEVQKEVIEENTVRSSQRSNVNTGSFVQSLGLLGSLEENHVGNGLRNESQNGKNEAFSRQKRIQNIFTLCGNYRELSQHNTTPIPTSKMSYNENLVASDQFENKENLQEKISKISGFDEMKSFDSKENYNPLSENTNDLEVYVKWEASKENPGKLISTIKVVKDATLADLRKLIEIHLGADNQAFTFLVLGDPSGAPVPREKEGTIKASKLPVCNNRLHGHLACLRPVKEVVQCPNHMPFSSLENILSVNPISLGDGFSPKVAQNLSTTTSSPFVGVQSC
ncbi:hypothetical protein LguiA_001398 [Lonicera macranthoides]